MKYSSATLVTNIVDNHLAIRKPAPRAATQVLPARALQQGRSAPLFDCRSAYRRVQRVTLVARSTTRRSWRSKQVMGSLVIAHTVTLKPCDAPCRRGTREPLSTSVPWDADLRNSIFREDLDSLTARIHSMASASRWGLTKSMGITLALCPVCGV